MNSNSHDQELEQSLLGAVMLVSDAAPKMVERLLHDLRLSSEHFYRPKHGAIWQTMVSLYDQGEAIDPTTISAELQRKGQSVEPSYLHTLATVTPSAGNYMSYGRRVVELADRRGLARTLTDMCEAFERDDMEAFRQAELRLTPQERREDSASPQEFFYLLWEYLERTDETAVSLPWPDLTTMLAGGLRPATVTLIGGYTGSGKSFITDQMLEYAAHSGRRTHVYMNEMAMEDRAIRAASRLTGVPISNILQRNLEPSEYQQLAKLENQMPYGATTITDWSVDEIARDIRRKRWDVCAIDLVHLIPFDDERGLASISSTLKHAALRANTALIEVVHLNRKGYTGSYPRPPSLGDVRWSGSLAENADNVILLYREEAKDDEGQALGTQSDFARLELAKARHGRLGQVRVKFDEKRGVFAIPADDAGIPL